MRWPFVKYTGCGNDFVLFDNRKGEIALSHPIIQKICHRQNGIGADGVILLENSSEADFKIRIFNSDGSEAEMCGNGLRCLIKFIQSLVGDRPSYCIETADSQLQASLAGNDVTVEMKASEAINWSAPISYGTTSYHAHYLNTGVPHAVIFMEKINGIDLQTLGSYIRSHAHFAPHGANVNIAQIISNQEIRIRTYERGVEAETLACGTGATAVALAAAYQYNLKSPISIITTSKESLIIGFKMKNNNFVNVTMTGPAVCTFEGIIDLST